MENKNMNRRKNHIDLIECLGMLFVIIYHSCTYSTNWIEVPRKLFYLRYFIGGIWSTCVPLFFIANGYLLLNKSMDLKKHIRKIVKIIILSYVWGIIGVITISAIKGNDISLRQIGEYLWKWEPIGWINHLWYMGALVCIYILFPIIKISYDNNKKYFYYFTIITAICSFGNTFIAYTWDIIRNCFMGENRVIKDKIFNMFNPFGSIHGFAFVYFCVGGILFCNSDKLKNVRHRNIIAIITIIVNVILLGVLGVYFSNVGEKKWDVVFKGYDTIFTFFIAMAIYVLCLSFDKEIALIKSISSNTLGIFFMHNIIIHLTKRYIVKIPFFCTVCGNVVYAFGIILLCLFVTLLLKKIPILKRIVTL